MCWSLFVAMMAAFAEAPMAVAEEMGGDCRPTYEHLMPPVLNYKYRPDKHWNLPESKRRELIGWLDASSREHCLELCKSNPECGAAIFDPDRKGCQLLDGRRILGWSMAQWEVNGDLERWEDKDEWTIREGQERMGVAETQAETVFEALFLNSSDLGRQLILRSHRGEGMACARHRASSPAQMWSMGADKRRFGECICPVAVPDLRCGQPVDNDRLAQASSVCQRSVKWNPDSPGLDNVYEVVCEIPARFTDDANALEEAERRRGVYRPFYRRLTEDLLAQLVDETGRVLDSKDLLKGRCEQEKLHGARFAFPPDLRETVSFNLRDVGSVSQVYRWRCKFTPTGNEGKAYSYSLGKEHSLNFSATSASVLF